MTNKSKVAQGQKPLTCVPRTKLQNKIIHLNLEVANFEIY